jgi:hypothetical protein
LLVEQVNPCLRRVQGDAVADNRRIWFPHLTSRARCCRRRLRCAVAGSLDDRSPGDVQERFSFQLLNRPSPH